MPNAISFYAQRIAISLPFCKIPLVEFDGCFDTPDSFSAASDGEYINVVCPPIVNQSECFRPIWKKTGINRYNASPCTGGGIGDIPPPPSDGGSGGNKNGGGRSSDGKGCVAAPLMLAQRIRTISDYSALSIDEISRAAGCRISIVDKPLRQAVDEALSIQTELAYTQKMRNEGITETTEGVLISDLTHEQMMADIEKGAQLILVHDLKAAQTIGYLFSLTGRQFIEHHPHTQVTLDCVGDGCEYARRVTDGEFVYLSQIGIRRSYHRTGVSSLILAVFEKSANNRLIVTAVIKKPLDNIVSRRFFKKHGYSAIGELYTPEFGGILDLRSELLAKDLK